MRQEDVNKAITAINLLLHDNPLHFKNEKSKKFSIEKNGLFYPIVVVYRIAVLIAGERTHSITTDVAYRKLYGLGFAIYRRKSNIF
jgi:hypothetical protein